MRQAVKSVRAALDNFYATLSDEQKAQFEAIGPRRTSAADQPAFAGRHARHHRISVAGLVRHLLSFAR